MLNKDSLTILIVTYSDRRKLVSKTIQSAIDIFHPVLKRIIFVQNGVEYDFNQFLSTLEIEKLKELEIETIINDENLGSAGGFGGGIEKFIEVSKNEDDYLLILDDDNHIPESTGESIKELDYKHCHDLYGDFAVSMYRPFHDRDKNKFSKDWDYGKDFYYNTVSYFSIIHKFRNTSLKQKRIDPNTAQLFTVPYSGLIVPRKIIENTESVQTQYYLYGDDSRFTAQISLKGFSIISRENIISEDLEESWYQKDESEETPKNAIQLFIESEEKDQMRPMYQIRNEIFTSKTVYKKSTLIFYINLIIYCVAPLFVYVKFDRKKIRNYKKFLKVVSDGLHGRLGKTY